MQQGRLKSRQILLTRVDGTTYQDACDRIQQWASDKRSCYIVAANVHVVMTAYWDSEYQEIIQRAALVTPDGMPLVWGLQQLGLPAQTRVYGPDLMLAWCQRSAERQIPIYLYGGTEETLQKVCSYLTAQFPGLPIAGRYAPPFRRLTADEEIADVNRIHQSGARVVFVALGCPKQEQWMARQQSHLDAVMIGVGAAFSFFGNEVAQAPRWMMRWGLEWAYRLSQEPRRLWKRYLFNNPAFMILFGGQLVVHQLRKILPNKKTKE